MRIALFLAAIACSAGAASPFKDEDPAGQAPGRWLCGTIGVGNTVALRGLAVRLGGQGTEPGAGIAYDLDLGRVAGFWTGKFVSPVNLMSRGEYPTALGEVVFTTAEKPGWNAGGGVWSDPRPERFGPLPASDLRCKGFHVYEGSTVVQWDVAGRTVWEQPESGGGGALVRRFRFAAGKETRVGVCPLEGAAGSGRTLEVAMGGADSGMCRLKREAAEWVLTVPASEKPLEVEVRIGKSEGSGSATPFERMLAGGKPHWPETVETAGEVSTDQNAAYVVDTVRLPEANPWNAPMYVGGHDFFADGRLAFCTFHGDVWVGEGIDAGLRSVKWRRFAAGLYHPLGLRVVDGLVYVAGRDGITRLRDVNGDGEADVYEAFNHDVKITPNFHEYLFDLQTDPAGNFYFAKAGPVRKGGRGFEQIMADHGTLIRVSKDGSRMETVATGFRAPNGIGCGPLGELTGGDNEGTWTPTCRLNWIRPGGFYGVVDLAHRPEPPKTYDPPLCWLPKRVDNSSGGQVWSDPERWGPWSGRLLHLSYGTCSLFGVLKEEVDGVVQGGVVRFPLKFQSGIMRGRVNPLDGQLYVSGLRGWQTTALKNGCIQRVRYTGKPLWMPVEIKTHADGVELRFDQDLDTKSAADPENYRVSVWNYVWSAAYGSPEVSTQGGGKGGEEAGREYTKEELAKAEHDVLEVRSATVSTDERSVFLEIQAFKPVMQLSLEYGLESASGKEIRGEVVGTVHRLGEAFR